MYLTVCCFRKDVFENTFKNHSFITQLATSKQLYAIFTYALEVLNILLLGGPLSNTTQLPILHHYSGFGAHVEKHLHVFSLT